MAAKTHPVSSSGAIPPVTDPGVVAELVRLFREPLTLGAPPARPLPIGKGER